MKYSHYIIFDYHIMVMEMMEVKPVMKEEKKPRKSRAKKVRTEAEVKADKERMAKLRALKGKK
jgi:hypothetical protein